MFFVLERQLDNSHYFCL